MANIFEKISKIRVILFFNNLRGLKVLRFLKRKKINIVYIFLSKKFLNKDILKYLKKSSLKFRVINNLNEKNTLEIIKKKSDLNIICGFPYIFPEKIIYLNKFGTINCHAGKLPNYRGGSPLNWQMINNERKIGLSVIKINKGIDTGDIINETTFNHKKSYTINELHKIANTIFPKLVYKSIKDIIFKKKLKKQSKKNNRYFKQRTNKDSLINLNKMNYTQLECFIRALQEPYPLAYFHYQNFKIGILKIKKSFTEVKKGKIKFKNKKFYLGSKDFTAEVMKYKKLNN